MTMRRLLLLLSLAVLPLAAAQPPKWSAEGALREFFPSLFPQILGGMNMSKAGTTGPPLPIHWRLLTLPVVGSSLTDFPVMVDQTLGAGKINNSSCFDVLFTSDSAGTAKLNWQIDTCDSSTGHVIAWVKDSLSSSTTTPAYMWYDGTQTSNQSPGLPWDSFTLAAYHFGDGSTLSLADATAGGHNLTNNSGVTAIAGKVGGAMNTGASAGFLSNASLSSNGALTVTFWVFWDNATTSGNGVFGFGSGPLVRFGLFSGGAAGFWDWQNNGAGQLGDSSAFSAHKGAWTKVDVVGAADGASEAIYYNGSLIASQAISPPATVASSSILDIGTSSFGIWTNGLLDEFHVSTTERSADWIATEYANQASPNTWMTVGPEN